MAYTAVFASTTLAVLVLVLASNISLAHAEPSPNDFLDILLPKPNTTGGPAGEITCYALPYGAMGIISHLLTYWTIAWVGWGKVPLWPSKLIRQYQFDLFLAIATLCTCIPIASITIVRCRLSWHFVLISVWKLVTSVSVAIISIHRCIIVRRENKRPKVMRDGRMYDPVDDGSHQNQRAFRLNERIPITQFTNKNPSNNQDKADITPLFWLILFLAGTIVGMVGLGSMLWPNFRDDTIERKTIRHLTYGFVAPMIIVPALVATYWYTEHCCGPSSGHRGMRKAYRHTFRGALAAFVAVFGFFSALYGDLVLGVIANNLLGTPTNDVTVLYWIWFIAKRFPLLSL